MWHTLMGTRIFGHASRLLFRESQACSDSSEVATQSDPSGQAGQPRSESRPHSGAVSADTCAFCRQGSYSSGLGMSPYVNVLFVFLLFSIISSCFLGPRGQTRERCACALTLKSCLYTFLSANPVDWGRCPRAAGIASIDCDLCLPGTFSSMTGKPIETIWV
jgi:hypothetical protein